MGAASNVSVSVRCPDGVAEIEALEGSFGIDSPPGKGTRVWAQIPVA